MSKKHEAELLDAATQLPHWRDISELIEEMQRWRLPHHTAITSLLKSAESYLSFVQYMLGALYPVGRRFEFTPGDLPSRINSAAQALSDNAPILIDRMHAIKSANPQGHALARAVLDLQDAAALASPGKHRYEPGTPNARRPTLENWPQLLYAPRHAREPASAPTKTS